MYDLIFYVHIASLCIAGIGVLMADITASEWLLGKLEVIGRKKVHLAHWTVTIGLAGLIGSGLYLFWPQRNYLLGQPLFWLKMAFVLALVINSFVIEYLMHTAMRRSFGSLTASQKAPFLISGAVSTLAWLGAFLVAITLF